MLAVNIELGQFYNTVYNSVTLCSQVFMATLLNRKGEKQLHIPRAALCSEQGLESVARVHLIKKREGFCAVQKL